MGAGQSSEKKSPTKEVKETQETEKSSPRKTSSTSTPEKDVKTPTKVPEVKVSGDSSPAATKPLDLEVSEEEVASVEAVSKKLLDTAGGTSIEIVLSPAVKKVII